MDDLDDLASAARSDRRVPNYMPPEQRGGRPIIWIALALGICVAIGVFLLVVRWGRSVGTPPTATLAPPPPPPPVVPPVAATSPGAQPAAPTSRRIIRQPSRKPLQDIADPFQALEIYHLQRGPGETIEIKARNISKRGLFVKSVELYAESNDRVPLDNLGFWLPAGESIVTSREVLELSRRLGDDEPIKAVVNEAEFRDTAPDELTEPSSGKRNRQPAPE